MTDPEPSPLADATTVAALDLGSNSFHMIVARVAGNRLMVIDRLKDMVRLAAGLDRDNHLSEEAIQRALASIARMSQRIRELPESNVRIVGTNTLRKARNGMELVERASAILGREVEIISGREEARLIYLAVSHAIEDNLDRRLVVDIGGGSTELILGSRFQPDTMDSLYMGCVSMSAEFFADGRITAAAMQAAELTARQELEPIVTRYRSHGWDSAIGTSGTILTIQDVLATQGWSSESITAKALRRLQTKLIKCGNSDRLSLPGLPAQRSAVFPGGVAILAAIFRSLGVDSMRTCTAALREGLLWDLVGRQHQSDIREQTVTDLCRRYHIDMNQAAEVRETALRLLAIVADHWQLTDPDHLLWLRWAAQLHEIGMDIAYAQYHKHGSYLLQHLDMPGFSRTEQRRLALLVRAHRRKLPLSELEASALDHPGELMRIILLLRCAVVMHRAREPAQSPPLQQILAWPNGLRVVFSGRWLRHHPLTRLDLAQEARAWSQAGYALEFSDSERETA